MNKTLITIGILIAASFFAAPVAAECGVVEETGTFYCANVDPEDTRNRDVFVSQAGVGYATYYASEFTFWGSTFRGEGASVATAYDSPVGSQGVGYDSFCFDQGSDDTCDFQGRYAHANLGGGTPVGGHAFFMGQDCADWDADGACDYEATSATLVTPENGALNVLLVEEGESTELCYEVDATETYECEALP